MLDKGIIERIVLDYKDIYKQALEDNLQSPAELPYFDGDFWPNVLEENIREVEQVRTIQDMSEPCFLNRLKLKIINIRYFQWRRRENNELRLSEHYPKMSILSSKEEEARKKELEEQERQAAAEAAAAAANEPEEDGAAGGGGGTETSPDGKQVQPGKKKGNQKKKKSAAQRKSNAKKNSQGSSGDLTMKVTCSTHLFLTFCRPCNLFCNFLSYTLFPTS